MSSTEGPAGRACGPAGPMGTVDELLTRNRQWAARKTWADPFFFRRLLSQQRPDYFWIGCSDSRVPATEIVDIDPGEMFVHRNVANLTPAHDPNFGAALHYAVEVLRVRHIMVVGHYGCGGIAAAASMNGDGDGDGAVGRWLGPVSAMCRQHEQALGAIGEDSARLDRLCELNVIAQIEQLANHPVVVSAWDSDQPLSLHGLVYGIGDGLLAPVCDAVSAPSGTMIRTAAAVAGHSES